MNKAVVLPCRGIGDALLMMIAAKALQERGYAVTTIHPKLHELSSWFPGHLFASEWVPDETTHIFAENDNSERIDYLKAHHREQLSIFYPTYSPLKHGPLHLRDYAFDPSKPMADNIAAALKSSKSNGLTPPFPLKRFPKRVLLHHTSSSPAKNWPLEKYEKIALALKGQGFDPVFVPQFEMLSDLAAFVYESSFVIGNDSLVGHLASNLGIPTLIIADKQERMKLWRPSWTAGAVVTLPKPLAHFRFCERNWQRFVSCRRVLKAFSNLSFGFFPRKRPHDFGKD